MMRNNDKGGFVELGGVKFKKVKNGLDEAQVESCIRELVIQRDEFMRREEHLSSLTRLAEKTVAEADKLAEEIRAEAKNQAKSEADEIMAKAEEQAQLVSEERRIEIINIANEQAEAMKAEANEQAEAMKAEANEQAEAMKAEANQEVESLLDNQRKKIQSEISNLAHQLYGNLLSELESLKQQVVGLEEGFEQKLAHPLEEVSTVAVEQDEESDEFMELAQTTEDRQSTGEPDWELGILPPIDVGEIMEVVTYLDNLSEVESTEIIPETDNPSILVFLREPINLTDVIKMLPEVAEVREDAADSDGANIKPKRVQIALKVKTAAG